MSPSSTLCNEQGHLEVDETAQSSVQPDLECNYITHTPYMTIVIFVQNSDAAGFNTSKFFTLEKLNPHYKQDVGKSDS